MNGEPKSATPQVSGSKSHATSCTLLRSTTLELLFFTLCLPAIRVGTPSWGCSRARLCYSRYQEYLCAWV